jgi:hypothetical protein
VIQQQSIEIADRMSRRRAVVVAAAAIIFLAVQGVSHPSFTDGVADARATRMDWWAVNVLVLLAALATGASGLLNPRGLRALVNDEVSRDHLRTSITLAYWLAMAIAMTLYFLPAFRGRSAQEAVYTIVTPSVASALLAFSFLELRAHRDA